jgi:hypothetical protein
MARLTKADFQTYRELSVEAEELARRARTLRQGMAAIETRAQEELEASGRESITRGGARIAWKVSRASISWRSELLDRIGAEGIAEIESATPEIRRVAISLPAAE